MKKEHAIQMTPLKTPYTSKSIETFQNGKKKLEIKEMENGGKASFFLNCASQALHFAANTKKTMFVFSLEKLKSQPSLLAHTSFFFCSFCIVRFCLLLFSLLDIVSGDDMQM